MTTKLQSAKPSALGTLTCYDCSGDFKSALINGTWIKCDDCGSIRGFTIAGVTCNCGNDVFQLTKSRAYCPDCGDDSRWEDLKTPLHRM